MSKERDFGQIRHHARRYHRMRAISRGTKRVGRFLRKWFGWLRVLKYLNPFRYLKRLDRYIIAKFIGTYIYSILLIISIAIQLVQQKLPGYVHADPSEIQVLTPMRKGLLGVERLNRILQEYLNPKAPEKKEYMRGEALFREGDKVMQIKNNYQAEWEIRGKYGMPIERGTGVFNGDMGIVREINEYTEKLTVEFDEHRYIEYPFGNLEELELAYAVTIHKSQGSEYPAVVIPLLSGPRMLMNRNLLYTAVTRAKSCVTLVGDPEVFYQMIDNTTQQKRYSSLALRMREMAAL